MSENIDEKVYYSLIELYESNRPFLTAYPWEWEIDRWNELVFTIFNEGFGVPSDLARKGVKVMHELNLTSISWLSSADEEQKLFTQRVLAQVGFDKQTADKAVNLLEAFANAVKRNWGGYIQQLLRDYGMKIVSEIETVLLSSGLTVNNARGVAILWLQNIANLPLLLTDSPHVERYCKEMGISSEQLLNYMDTFGLNVSVLDDLLALKDGSKAGVGYDPKKWTPRKGIY